MAGLAYTLIFSVLFAYSFAQDACCEPGTDCCTIQICGFCPTTTVGTTETDVTTTPRYSTTTITEEPSTTDTPVQPDPQDQVDIGAIVGGAFGGVGTVLATLGAAYKYYKRAQQMANEIRAAREIVRSYLERQSVSSQGSDTVFDAHDNCAVQIDMTSFTSDSDYECDFAETTV